MIICPAGNCLAPCFTRFCSTVVRFGSPKEIEFYEEQASSMPEMGRKLEHESCSTHSELMEIIDDKDFEEIAFIVSFIDLSRTYINRLLKSCAEDAKLYIIDPKKRFMIANLPKNSARNTFTVMYQADKEEIRT